MFSCFVFSCAELFWQCVLLGFRSELIQLVTVTQKEAESSYRELIKEQIYMYKNRWVFSVSLFLMCLRSCSTEQHAREQSGLLCCHICLRSSLPQLAEGHWAFGRQEPARLHARNQGHYWTSSQWDTKHTSRIKGLLNSHTKFSKFFLPFFFLILTLYTALQFTELII